MLPGLVSLLQALLVYLYVQFSEGCIIDCSKTYHWLEDDLTHLWLCHIHAEIHLDWNKKPEMTIILICNTNSCTHEPWEILVV